MMPDESPQMANPEIELPLLDLFLRLRDADLPLGIDEYHTLIRALRLGFGTRDTESLRRLCQTLWAKTPYEERLLNYNFDSTLGRQVAEQGPVPVEVPPGDSEEPKSPIELSGVPQPQSVPSLPGGIGSSAVSFGAADEIQMRRTVDTALEASGLPAQRFILTGAYYPVTRRQMKQSWRYLRRMLREGPSVVLNVEETVKKVGREGVLLEPVLEPRRINSMELLLLVDQKGSMVPFHYLSHSLVETAQMGGRLGQAGFYYFQNVPRNYLYLTSALIEAKSMDSVFSGLFRDRTVALIFSDAGAARGRLNRQRIDLTRTFLERAQLAVRRIAWLNPMPRARWQGTTAEGIAGLVPMFEFSRYGMDAAIDVLRGRTKPMLGRV